MTNNADFFDILEMLMDPHMDEIELDLRSQGQEALANSLLRITVDAGVDYAKSFDDYFDAEAGPETANIAKDYTPVTVERLAIFDDIDRYVPDNSSVSAIRTARKALLATRPIPPPAPGFTP